MRILMLAIISSLVIACSSSPPVAGSYAETASAVGRELARDAADEINRRYAPARTRIVMGQVVEDEFGRWLVRALRNDGYAVKEVPAGMSPPDEGTFLPYGSYRISYLVDRIAARGSTDTAYRVNLAVDGAVFTRGFALIGDAVYPLGSWSVRSADER